MADHNYVAEPDVSLTCPACNAGNGAVMVRALDHYTDGYEVDAYCLECGASLVVQASVEVTFLWPEVRDG